MRLVVEALVPGADVTEDRRPLRPIGELDALLGLGRRGLGLLGGLLDLLLRGLADRLLLLDLPLQLADLLLRLSELLFEEPEPLLSRRFRRGPPGGADEARREHDDEHE